MRWRHLLMHRPGNGRWKQFFFDRMRMIDWEDETGWRGRRNWAIISRDLISSRRADTKLLLTPVFAAVGVSCCGYRVHWSASSCVVSRISSIGRFYFWKQLFHYHDREKCVGRIDNNKTFVFFFNMRKIIQLFFFGVDEKVKFRSESFFFHIHILIFPPRPSPVDDVIQEELFIFRLLPSTINTLFTLIALNLMHEQLPRNCHEQQRRLSSHHQNEREGLSLFLYYMQSLFMQCTYSFQQNF